MAAKYTIQIKSDGNHGHQLKDFLGGLVIGRLLGLEYVSTPYKYLRYFGTEYGRIKLPKWQRRFHFKNIIRIKGPFWDGFSNYEDFIIHFNKLIDREDEFTLYIFEDALRVHPCQVIEWFNSEQINIDIFSAINLKISSNYLDHNKLMKAPSEVIKIAIHINRGVDYQKDLYPDHFESSRNVRYMFPLKYYQTIIDQIQEKYESRNYTISIYTEALYSEKIIDAFYGKKNIKVKVGSNRGENNISQIEEIFREFVMSNILVCSNSSFSAVAAYFRYNKTTIYHPHKHLYNLPLPNYIPTSENGIFDSSMLPDI